MEVHSYDLKLANALKLARARTGLSQVELARRVGITFQQIQKYERGANRVVFSRFIQLCEALETSPDAMLAEALRDDRVELGGQEDVGDREAFRLYRLAHHVPSRTRQAVLDLMRAVSRRSDDEA
jgi:transcriptional regulator with XRE-family HTH domain